MFEAEVFSDSQQPASTKTMIETYLAKRERKRAIREQAPLKQ